ncbi:MAG: hypothetical protein ACJA2T_001558 [Gammaproteobacteria bacterium]|jgi:hypothetical protein
MVSFFIPVEDTLIIEGDRNNVPILGSHCRLAASFNKSNNAYGSETHTTHFLRRYMGQSK